MRAVSRSFGVPQTSRIPIRRIVERSRRLVVLTGAGCSTESGIPDYRSANGTLRKHKPMQFGEFKRSADARRRYWARSFAGWQRVYEAQPNRAHLALAELESRGNLHHLITQNVDGLHQAAGSQRVLELHGSLDGVTCLSCARVIPRPEMQRQLLAANPGWEGTVIHSTADGDAEIEPSRLHSFQVPGCRACGGVLKPAVVFFGETVPPERVQRAMAYLEEADALLIVGSSLMVWSGFRFARAAAQRGTPIAIVNVGPTRADDLAAFKIEARCGDILPDLIDPMV